ncbi:MAG: signal peptidase I [Micavibrio sp.]|nr:signal peptidase I [Micavibrio sp.]
MADDTDQKTTPVENAAEIAAETAAVQKQLVDRKEKDDATELVKAMVFAAIIALLIRSLLFEPFNIPSGSMFPTLLVGDYLFVEKWSYGYSMYSFPLDAIPFHGRLMQSPVTRGDVVVFRQPKRVGIDYIKRIIGLPGDRIQVKEGRLYINGDMVPRKPEGMESLKDEGQVHMFHKYLETLPNGVEHYIYELGDSEALDNTPEYVVPENHYFAMGDNRDQSLDSRVQSEVGYIPEENLIGRAVMLFYSSDEGDDDCQRDGVFGAIRSVGCKAVELPKNIRFSRIFHRVSAL